MPFFNDVSHVSLISCTQHEQALLNGDHHYNGDDVDGHHSVNDERPVTVGEQVRQESDSAGGAPVLATAHLTMDQSKDFGGGGDESGVGSVTDSSSVASKRNKMGKDDDSDHSDSGWDTDLEIDGKCKNIIVFIENLIQIRSFLNLPNNATSNAT